jgi:hypothetical protein
MRTLCISLLLCFCALSSCQDFDKSKYVTKEKNERNTETQYPFVSGDLFRQLSDHIVDNTHIPFYPRSVKENDIVFVKTKYLRRFTKYMHPKIKHPYILITHNGDEEIPGQYEWLLDDKKIILWFGMNTTKVHPKLVTLPIGFGSAEVARTVAALRDQHFEKVRLVYLNFASTHPEREEAREYFSKMPFCKVDPRRPFSEYIEEVMRSKFQVSPRGNGIDCHRVWETIFAGTIPILKSTPLDPLYEDLPVLIVREWSEVNEDFLNQKYSEIVSREYDFAKLYADYWIKLIAAFSNRSFALQPFKDNSQTPADFSMDICLSKGFLLQPN